MSKLLPRLQEKWDALGDEAHRSLFNQMKSTSLPFWWHGPTPDDPEIYNNGTLCLVDTGKRVVGVTAWHVWEWYRKRLEIGKPFVCQFGGLTVEPENLRIDHDKRLELATFDLADAIRQMAGFVPHRLDSWPPERPEVDDLMLYGGFPGNMRRADLVQATFSFDTVTGLVSQVTSQNIVIEVDYSRLHDADGPKGHVVAADPAGSSGGPVYRIRDMPLVGHRLELAGFIYEQAKEHRSCSRALLISCWLTELFAVDEPRALIGKAPLGSFFGGLGVTDENLNPISIIVSTIAPSGEQRQLP